MKLSTVFVLVALVLSGCAGVPSSGPSSAPSATAPDAVHGLLDLAQQARASGDFAAASAHIERALRIDRRSPQLYLELARIRHADGAFGQAESLALKAASLAPRDTALQSSAWSVVAQARAASGDKAGAAAAWQRAGTP